jgi:hypothetical protein
MDARLKAGHDDGVVLERHAASRALLWLRARLIETAGQQLDLPNMGDFDHWPVPPSDPATHPETLAG